MIHFVKQVIEKSDSGLGKAFDLFIQFLIVTTLVAFSVETIPNISETTQWWLGKIEIACVAIFTIEYLGRLIVADNKVGFVCSFFGIIDLLAIVPFYFAMGIDLRSVRIFRLLRLFRVFKLARYSNAMQRFHRAFLIIKEELILFLFVTVILLYLAAVGIYHFENEAQPATFASVFHSLWWAVITLTTVGYGDVYPITLGGRIFTFFVLIVGLGVVSIPAGLVASALTEARKMEIHGTTGKIASRSTLKRKNEDADPSDE